MSLFLWRPFQFFCTVTCVWMFCLFQSRYVDFTQVSKFHDSFILDDFFFQSHHRLLSKLSLCDSSRPYCPAHRQWVGFLWHRLRQLLWKRDSHANKSKPRILRKSISPLFIFCSFKHSLQALTLKHCSGFSCQRSSSLIFFRPTSLHNILSDLKITFTKAVEERPDILDCWSVYENLVEDFRRWRFLVKHW